MENWKKWKNKKKKIFLLEIPIQIRFNIINQKKRNFQNTSSKADFGHSERV